MKSNSCSEHKNWTVPNSQSNVFRTIFFLVPNTVFRIKDPNCSENAKIYCSEQFLSLVPNNCPVFFGTHFSNNKLKATRFSKVVLKKTVLGQPRSKFRFHFGSVLSCTTNCLLQAFGLSCGAPRTRSMSD